MRRSFLSFEEIRILPQPAAEFDGSTLPAPLTEIPWGHNVVLLEKLKNPAERLWYAKATVENGWSRAVLDLHIESELHRRQGKALTNFHRTLPAPDSDLAQQVLKDSLNFEFLTLAEEAHERELERGLIEHIRKFLLELGEGLVVA